MSYRKYFDRFRTLQLWRARADQVRNRAGGYVWEVDDLARVRRFLILGAFATYYARRHVHVKGSTDALLRALEKDGARVVEEIHDVSVHGRAYKNEPALFALAAALSTPSLEVRQAAERIFPDVVRTGMHLFQAAHYLEGFRGWGRLARRAFTNWYLNQPVDRLAYQVIKYQGRRVEEGDKGSRWAHRDILRLAHPQTSDPVRNAVLYYAVKGELPANAPEDEALRLLRAYQAIKAAQTEGEVIDLIQRYRLTWEFVPGQWLGSADVWRALLPGLPLAALIRNLARLTALGALKPLSPEVQEVTQRLTNMDALRKARIHPLQVLVAAKIYSAGFGVLGSLQWEPLAPVMDALDKAFYLTFENAEPTGKRLLVGLDISGSMGWGRVAGAPLTPREAAAALASVWAAKEQTVHFMAFSETLHPFPIQRREPLARLVRRMAAMPFGRTDCALPMLYARQKRLKVDTFIILTDNETWFGKIHPFQALQQYRRKYNPEARLVVVGMISNGFTIADPTDPGMLDVVGFDTATPRLVNAFARGEV